jgi:hypothetical protein
MHDSDDDGSRLDPNARAIEGGPKLQFLKMGPVIYRLQEEFLIGCNTARHHASIAQEEDFCFDQSRK